MLARFTPKYALPVFLFLCMAGWQLYMHAPFTDPDTGWHISAGEWIVTHHQLPAHDPWSFTAESTPWYNLSWGFDVLVYGLFALGGLSFIYFLTILAYSLMAMLLARQALERGAGPIVVIGFFILVAGPLIAQSTWCRPHIISAFLFYISIQIFARDREKPSNARLAWLPLIMVLWVNMHGGFILMAVLFAVHLVEALAVDDWVRIRRLFTVGIFTAMAILINPYGYHIYDGTMRTLDSVITNSIKEWRSVDFAVMWWYDMAILAFVFGLRPMERMATFSEKALALATLLLSLHSARLGLMLAIAATPLLAKGLTLTLYSLPNAEHHRLQDQKFQNFLGLSIVRKAAMAGMGILLFLMVAPDTRMLLAPHADQLNGGKTPLKALEYIRGHYPESMRWMNDYSLGGPIIFYSKGNFPLFIDGRAGTAYSEAFLKDYLRVMETYAFGKTARDILRKYDIDGLIIDPQSRLNTHLKVNPLWNRVYKDDAVALYVRKLKAD